MLRCIVCRLPVPDSAPGAIHSIWCHFAVHCWSTLRFMIGWVSVLCPVSLTQSPTYTFWGYVGVCVSLPDLPCFHRLKRCDIVQTVVDNLCHPWMDTLLHSQVYLCSLTTIKHHKTFAINKNNYVWASCSPRTRGPRSSLNVKWRWGDVREGTEKRHLLTGRESCLGVVMNMNTGFTAQLSANYWLCALKDERTAPSGVDPPQPLASPTHCAQTLHVRERQKDHLTITPVSMAQDQGCSRRGRGEKDVVRWQHRDSEQWAAGSWAASICILLFYAFEYFGFVTPVWGKECIPAHPFLFGAV